MTDPERVYTVPTYSDSWLTVYQGDCREVMASMEPGSVHCVVTSPPYWGLRDYGTATWIGGDEGCPHAGGKRLSDKTTIGRSKGKDHQTLPHAPSANVLTPYRDVCGKCGAIREDGQLGLEPTPEEYVANMVAVFRAVRRVLRDDGTVWLNLGDSYAVGRGDTYGGFNERYRGVPSTTDKQAELGGMRPVRGRPVRGVPGGSARDGYGQLKPKDLVGIPWLVARALQEPYYTGRIRREKDRVWLAAMIDAEGTICGFDHDRADGGGHRSGVHLTITNSSTALLDEAARIWPTSRSKHQDPTRAGHLGTLMTWRWIVHGIENKMAALRELYPYLIAKRQQAVVGYTLLTLMADAKRLGHSSQKDAVLAKRRVLTGLLSDLNHQRPVVMPSWMVEPPGLTEPGWYLRSDIIWAKPNPMPESVTDRPTKSHEYLFLLSKSPRYWFDAEAVREPDSGLPSGNGFDGRMGGARQSAVDGGIGSVERFVPGAGRNIRSVWTVATQPYPGAHFATFPEKLVEPCVKAGCPDRVCPECGQPWRRVTEQSATVPQRQNYHGDGVVERHRGGAGRVGGFYPDVRTLGWLPTCDHGIEPFAPDIASPRERQEVWDRRFGASVPGVVLDPFAGSGTTGRVAQRLSRRAVLIDLNADYLVQAMERNRELPLGLESA